MKLLIMTVALLTMVTKVNSEAWVVQTKGEGETMGCTCFEASYAVSRILDSAPVTLEMSFQLNVSREYERAWGRESLTSKKDEHAEHFKCAKKIASSVDELTTRFIERIETMLKIREDSYLSTMIKEKREAPHTDETARSEQGTNALMNFDGLDRGSEEGQISEMKRKINEETSFVLDQRWLADRIRREVSGQTRTNDTVSRVKRNPWTFVSTVISVVALASSVGSSIYLSNRLERLIDYIDDLSQSVEKSWINQKNIYDDAVVLKDSQGLIALGLKQMSGVLERLIDANACIMDQTEILFELRDIANRFSLIESDLMMGTVTTRLISLPMLKEIFKYSSFEDETYLSSVPTIFFRQSAVSVLKTDKKDKTIALLLISPRVERQPSYQLITLHGIDTSFKINGQIYNKRLIFEQRNYAVPMEIYNRHRSDMNLTLSEISQIRIPINCFVNSGIYQCHNFVTLDRDAKLCLFALLQHDYDTIMSRCQMKVTKVDSFNDVSHSQGATGVLLSLRGNLRVYGSDSNQATMFKKDELTKMKSLLPVCLWVPSFFSEITVENNGKVIESIKTENHLFLRNPVLGSILNFDKNHFRYYRENLTASKSQIFNFTGITDDINAHWKTIKDIALRKFRLNDGFSVFEIIVITTATLVGGIFTFKLVKCILNRRRKQRRENSYGESADLGQRVTYDARSQRLWGWNNKPANRQQSQIEDEIEDHSDELLGGPDSLPPKRQQSSVKTKPKAAQRKSKTNSEEAQKNDDPTDGQTASGGRIPKHEIKFNTERVELLGLKTDPAPYEPCVHFCPGSTCVYCPFIQECDTCNGHGCMTCLKRAEQVLHG